MSIALARLQKEVSMLQADPPPGAWANPIEGKPLTELEAGLLGPVGTVYEGGVFKLEVNIPLRYPIEPPKFRFITPLYHPNIDRHGRICLDILNPPPKGGWKPSLNISTVLVSLGLLLAEPNADDGLVTDITEEYKERREVFDRKAREWTQKYAAQGNTIAECKADSEKVVSEPSKAVQKSSPKDSIACDTEPNEASTPALPAGQNGSGVGGSPSRASRGPKRSKLSLQR